MRKVLAAVILPATLLAAGCGPEKEVALETEIDKMSYGIGTSMGRSVKNQPVEVNAEALVAGLRDVLSDKEMRLDEAAIREAFASVREKEMEKQQLASEETLKLGEAYITELAQKEGIQKTDKGVYYEVLQEGKGDSPAETDVVEVHYHGTLIDGAVFDSSIERGSPAKFPVNRVIPGWTDALQLMKVGDKWRLHIPSKLAYDAQSPSPKIPANSTLVFEVELLSIEKS